jgi:hypothetical protein
LQLSSFTCLNSEKKRGCEPSKAGGSCCRTETESCTIRNLSAGGACLELASQVGIPDAFDLIIGEGNVRRPCRVAWRKANRMGVQFAHRLDH